MASSLLTLALLASAADPVTLARPDAFKTLVNPNCSHCVDEAKRRASELKPDDPVLVWTRGYSDGGAVPLRFFLNPYRVISDSYGVFVYDPDAGYARGFAPSYKFTFHGWRNGVMVLKHADGTLYSGLTGVAFDGPRKGDRLQPVPTLMSTWGEWMQRYPHAVAYHMFDKYKPTELPCCDNPDAVKTRPAMADPRLTPDAKVLGVWADGKATAFDLSEPAKGPRYRLVEGRGYAVVHDAKTGSAAAYRGTARQPRKYDGPQPNDEGVSPPNPGRPLPDGKEVPDRAITLAVDGDKVVSAGGNEWDIAGRCVAGPLNGWTLEPVDAVVCKWVAWSAEYPATAVLGASWGRHPLGEATQEEPASRPGKKRGVDSPRSPKTDAMKEVAGAAEFLRVLPKPFGVLKAVDPAARTVTLLFDGESVAKVWPVEPDAEVKVNGWWGRLEQLKPGERVWAWLKLDRKKNPVSVAMLADAASAADIRGTKPMNDAKQAEQKAWLRQRWDRDGLPGTLTFAHVFSGELEVMLDHEGQRWARSLALGDVVHLTADPPIKGVVKHVTPWRERTLVRLVVGELESSELKVGQRVGVKPAKPLPADAAYPADIGRPRSEAERVDWFLANVYCVCGVDKDTCTGHFYTLASCNPNGCGAPNATRKQIRDLIAQGRSDREIWDALLADRGPLMLKPHLKP